GLLFSTRTLGRQQLSQNRRISLRSGNQDALLAAWARCLLASLRASDGESSVTSGAGETNWANERSLSRKNHRPPSFFPAVTENSSQGVRPIPRHRHTRISIAPKPARTSEGGAGTD